MVARTKKMKMEPASRANGWRAKRPRTRAEKRDDAKYEKYREERKLEIDKENRRRREIYAEPEPKGAVYDRVRALGRASATVDAVSLYATGILYGHLTLPRGKGFLTTCRDYAPELFCGIGSAEAWKRARVWWRAEDTRRRTLYNASRSDWARPVETVLQTIRDREHPISLVLKDANPSELARVVGKAAKALGITEGAVLASSLWGAAVAMKQDSEHPHCFALGVKISKVFPMPVKEAKKTEAA